MGNIYLEKPCTKCGGVASLRTFQKKIKIEHISESTVWNVIKFVFIVCPMWGLSKYIKKKVPKTFFLP